jgi:ubiquinone biosynthesis protein
MAVRACCEPFFNKPIKDISLGLVLMRLFDASRRFNVEIQPQLVLLQKTLLNTEGLGRTLNPELDLWETAQPILERWMKEQLGWPAFKKRFMAEAPKWAELLPELPRLLHSRLAEKPSDANNQALALQLGTVLVQQRRLKRNLWFVGVLAISALLACVAMSYVLWQLMRVMHEAM